MRDGKIGLDPGHEMVFESSLDELMEDVWGNQLVDVCSWKIVCKWLDNYVSRFPAIVQCEKMRA